MQIKEAKLVFNTGGITRFISAHNPLKPTEWVLLIELKKGLQYPIETVRNETKSYKTIEYLLADVYKITGRVTSLTVNI